MIVSKQSLIDAAARDIFHAARLDDQAAVERALADSGAVLYANVVEIDEADQMEILASIRDTVSDGLGSNHVQDAYENRRFSKLLADFANGFVDASETMGLTAIDHDALRISVANALGNVDAAHAAGTN
jgi:hypothetical protein